MIHVSTETQMANKANTALNWMRKGIPTRFQDETKNMQEDIDDMFKGIEATNTQIQMSPEYQQESPKYYPLHPPSPLQLPPNATISCVQPLQELKRQRAITYEESVILDHCLKIATTLDQMKKSISKIHSTVYANNHALRDLVSTTKKQKRRKTQK